MPQDLTDDKSTLVKVMAWCRQATSHYLSQCWPRSLSLYGVTRPQCVNWAMSRRANAHQWTQTITQHMAVPHWIMTGLSLNHWGRMTHICVSKPPIICSNNVLSPGRRQAIFWTNAGVLLIGPLRTNSSEILIQENTFENVIWKWRPFFLGLNVVKKFGIYCNISDGVYRGPGYWNKSITYKLGCGDVF